MLASHTPSAAWTVRSAGAAGAVLALTAGLLAGCSSSETATDTAASSSASPSSTAAAADASVSPPGRPGGGGMGGSAVEAPAATFTDVAYATTSSSQVLDLWLPEGATEATPLVIYIHGGAFKMGDKSMVGAKVQSLLDAGYAVASINYRLSGEELFPAAVQDSKAAVRYLRANAETYNLNPDAFATWGESAGGNLASMVGVSGDQTTVLDDSALGNADVSSAVQAVVDWYGPTDFLQMDTQSAESACAATAEEHDPASSPESAYLGAAIQTVPDLAAQANPITYVADATTLPAFSIAHGTADCNVAPGQAGILADALTAAGQATEVTYLDGASHADARFDSELLASTIAWLDTVLR